MRNLLVNFMREVKMPTSLKQLDQCYESVCNNINDAKEYTIQNLRSNINLDVPTFYTDLGSSNLEQPEEEIDVMEQVLNQCRIAIKNENSRRMLQEQMIKLTERQKKKITQQHKFKIKKREARLTQATPCPTRQPLVTE